MIAQLEALLRQRSRDTLDADRHHAGDTAYDEDLDARLAEIERATAMDQEPIPF